MNDPLEPLAGVLDPIRDAGRRWRFFLDWRPFGTNEERGWHYHQRAKVVDQWRQAFRILGLAERRNFTPTPDRIRVTAIEHMKSGRGHDVGGTLPAVKAAVDGLVDAGLVPHDGPRHVIALTFLVPIKSATAGLEVVVKEIL